MTNAFIRSASLGASLNNLSPTRLTVFLLLLPLSAHAQSSLKVVSLLADSEQSKILTFIPAAELSHSTKKESVWSADIQLRYSAMRLGDAQTELALRLKEATIRRKLNDSFISIGRILVRPQSSSLNENTKSFMRSEPVSDGILFSSKDENTSWSIYGGAPQVAGFAVAHDYGTAKIALLYRGERNKVSNFPVLNVNGIIESSPRAANSHEAELTIRTFAQKIQTEALFQLLNQGPQKSTTPIEESLGDFTLGSIDTSLPRSYNEYRIAAQVKFPLSSSTENVENLLISWASRTAPRFHDGTENEKFFRQGGGNDTQISVAVEAPTNQFSLQLGSSIEYSLTPRYSFMAKRLSSGTRELNKAKATLWTSVRTQL